MGKKLTSENGETLTELLISVLVIALGLSMFAAALTASRKMLILGTEKIETYYSERNDLEGEKSEKVIKVVAKDWERMASNRPSVPKEA